MDALYNAITADKAKSIEYATAIFADVLEYYGASIDHAEGYSTADYEKYFLASLVYGRTLKT